MKKIIMLLSVFVLVTVVAAHAQGFQQVYNRLNQMSHIHLGRGNMPELNVWAHQIVTGQAKMEAVVYGIVNSDEAKARAAELASGTADAATDTAPAKPFGFVPGFWVRLFAPAPAFVILVQHLKYQSLINLGKINISEIRDWARQVLQGKEKLEDIILGMQNGDEAEASTDDDADSSDDSETDDSDNSAEASDSIDEGSDESPVDGLGA